MYSATLVVPQYDAGEKELYGSPVGNTTMIKRVDSNYTAEVFTIPNSCTATGNFNVAAYGSGPFFASNLALLLDGSADGGQTFSPIRSVAWVRRAPPRRVA